MSAEPVRVGIVGAGRVGIGLAELTARQGAQVVLFTSLGARADELSQTRRCVEVLPELERLNEGVAVTTDPEALARNGSLVFVTVSREFFPGVFDRVAPFLDGGHQVVHAVHTLEGERLRRTSLRIAETSAARQVGALAGPAHVADMLVGRPNALIVGSAYPAVLSAVVEVLEAPALRVETTADLRGVELAAASSQVLSLAAGLADGLELGAAFHAIILSRGLLEVARVGAEVGASLETFAGLAGLGRLLDAVRRGEPNYALGCTLGRANARVAVQRAEHPEALGVEVAATLQLAAASRGMSLPVVEAVADVMAGRRAPFEALQPLYGL